MKDEQKYANIVDMVSDFNNDKNLILQLTQQLTDLEAKLAKSEKKLKEMEHRFLLQYDIRSMYESSYLDLVKRFQALKEQCEKRGKQIVVKSGGKAKKFNEDNAYKLRYELAGADEEIARLREENKKLKTEIEEIKKLEIDYEKFSKKILERQRQNR